MNSPFFNLHRDFSNWLCQINANSPGVEFLRALSKFRKRKKIHCCLVTSSIKREIRHFHIVVVHKKSKEMYEKVWCKCKVVVLLIKPIDFLTFWFPSSSSDLKVPTVEDWLDRLKSALKHFPILIYLSVNSFENRGSVDTLSLFTGELGFFWCVNFLYLSFSGLF